MEILYYLPRNRIPQSKSLKIKTNISKFADTIIALSKNMRDHVDWATAQKFVAYAQLTNPSKFKLYTWRERQCLGAIS
jgi:hypothetical protein